MKEAPAKGWRQREDDALVAKGFEPLEEIELWRKDGILFGRVAALQKLQRERQAEEEEAMLPHQT